MYSLTKAENQKNPGIRRPDGCFLNFKSQKTATLALHPSSARRLLYGTQQQKKKKKMKKKKKGRRFKRSHVWKEDVERSRHSAGWAQVGNQSLHVKANPVWVYFHLIGNTQKTCCLRQKHQQLVNLTRLHHHIHYCSGLPSVFSPQVCWLGGACKLGLDFQVWSPKVKEKYFNSSQALVETRVSNMLAYMEGDPRQYLHKY